MSIRPIAMTVIAGTAAMLGCSSAPPAQTPSSRSEQVDELERTGRVVVSGPEGMRMVSLLTEAGQSVGLVGELIGELTRLSGAVVAVAGAPAQTPQSEGLRVTRYEVVSIDGEVPVVGVLSGENGDFRLEDGQSVSLVDLPEALLDQVGAKIWVTGPETPNGRRVQSYGVIRPAP